MDIKTLTTDISVCGQIKHRDVLSIAGRGFKTIINNRPNQEVPFQPRSNTLAKHAKQCGVSYHYLPVISGKMTQENVDEFAALLVSAEGPVLAFCRTGTRSTNLWARANPDNLSAEDITQIGRQAGYEI